MRLLVLPSGCIWEVLIGSIINMADSFIRFYSVVSVDDIRAAHAVWYVLMRHVLHMVRT